MKNTYLILVLLPLICCSLVAQTTDIALLHSAKNFKTTGNLPGHLVYVPFDVVDGKILVNARLDGAPRVMMLDTGAPGLVLHSEVINEEETGQGVHGTLSLAQTTVREFEWAGVRTADADALLLDMDHLPADGLLGYALLKDYEVLFNCQNRQLMLYGNRKNDRPIEATPAAVLHLDFYEHLPILKIKIGKRSYRFLLDSGAETNVIDKSLLQKVQPHISGKTHRRYMTGLDGKDVKVKAADLRRVQIADRTLPDMTFLFADLSSLREDARIDGILGFPFFNNLVFSLNYRKGRLFLW